MPSCSVLCCKNRSQSKSFENSGITYHLYPKCPNIKEKWLAATGRGDDWFPTKTSTICSLHFEEKCYRPIAKGRRLFATAVPTLKLRMVYASPIKPDEDINTIINPNSVKSIAEQYNDKIEKYKNVIKSQKAVIKRLRSKTNRHRKKVETMKIILDALRNEHVIGEEHMWLLESEHL